jgi:adenosylhomocysteine nucleosidase
MKFFGTASMRGGTMAAPRVEAGASGAVAIVAALDRELAALRASTAVVRHWREGTVRAVLGRLAGIPVILARTGDGAGNAARGVELLLDRLPVGSVMVVGAAGALSPHLEPGRVLVAREVIEEGQSVPLPDAGWLRRALRDAGATPATFVSTRDLLCTARAKAEAYARLSRGTAAAVDLETAAYARAAGERGLPYVALRAISDAAEESLPVDFNALRDATGAVDGRRVALTTLARPSLLVPMWRLRGRIALCSENLARAVSALLSGGPS